MTDGYWWRTARAGEAFVRAVDLPVSGPMARVALALRTYPLYLENEEEQGMYRTGGDPLLAVAVDQLQGAGAYDCILLDHTEVILPRR